MSEQTVAERLPAKSTPGQVFISENDGASIKEQPRRPAVGSYQAILRSSVASDIKERTLLTDKEIETDGLTDGWGGIVKNCLKAENDRLVDTTVYRSALQAFGHRLGKDVEIKLCYKREVDPVDNLDGKGAEVIITERIAPNLEIVYVIKGNFSGWAATGSANALEHGCQYADADQIIIHDLESDQASDINSFVAPGTQLRYVPVTADSDSSRKFFGQKTGVYLQVENITNLERFGAVLHEVGHELIEEEDPMSNTEAADIMSKVPGGMLQMLPTELLRRLAELLPTIERGASDKALELWEYFNTKGINLGSEENVKQLFNQGLLSYQESLRKDLGDKAVSFKLYE